MNGLHDVRSRPWVLLAVVIGFIAAHLILFHFLRRLYSSHVAVPGVVVVGVVFLIVGKHLGLLAALVRSLHTSFRRRS
jgi:hypothetical protein